MSIRTIKVELPTISMMKMHWNPTIELSGTETLKEVKERIFHKVWDTLPTTFRKHGSPEDVILKYDEEEVCSDEQLQQRLMISHCFQATFKSRSTCERKNLMKE